MNYSYSDFKVGNIVKNSLISQAVEIVKIENSIIWYKPIVGNLSAYNINPNIGTYSSPIEEFEGLPIWEEGLRFEGFERISGMDSIWMKTTRDGRGFPINLKKNNEGYVRLIIHLDNSEIEYHHELQNSFDFFARNPI